ncbi:MAG: hypothetical protein AAGI38_17450 [Bacteroidota bacterium]
MLSFRKSADFKNSTIITKILKRNGGNILDNVPLEEAETYLQLKTQLHDTSIIEDTAFQKEYQQVYPETLKKKPAQFRKAYFQLLESQKTEQRVDIRESFRRLFSQKDSGKFRHKDFSYLTQLAHTVDYSQPLYEQEVGEFFDFKKPRKLKMSNRERLNAYMGFYRHMKAVYGEILEEKKLHDLLTVFKIKLKREGLRLPPAKRLDLVMRTAARMEQSGELVLAIK